MVKKAVHPLLAIKNISVYRGETPALRNFSWTVEPGQHWAVLGPNGSGKSTLVQVLQGWLWPREGEMQVLGNLFGNDDVAELRRRVAWVGAEAENEFPPNQTVAEIAVSGTVGTLGVQFDIPDSQNRESALEALRFLGMERLAARPFRALSHGQRRLTVIARALAMRPDLLLLDEPAAGLDPIARERFLNRVSRLLRSNSKPLIIYITHHLEEILPGFTHVLCLRKGRIVMQGPKAKVLTSAVLRKVFGEPVTLNETNGRIWLRPDGP